VSTDAAPGAAVPRPLVRAVLGDYADQMGPWLAPMLGPVGADLETEASAEGRPADVLLSLSVDRAAIEPGLTGSIRWIHVLATGVDGFPFDLVGERVLTCSRGASGVAIAEFVLACMLAFEKRLPGSWVGAPPPRWSAAELGGLAGRTLGLVGLGAIGTAVARRALAFDMEVVALRRTAAPPSLAPVTLASSLHDLLGRSDHVVVAAPATTRTSRLFDAAAFSAMKPGAHFVNIARGSLVDQEALLGALDSGHIALASLDVVDPEPLPAGHPLYTHPRVRLSPHVSWSSPATLRVTFELFLENLRRYGAGQPLDGVVDVDAGY
jgi:phosphoglycerate dehydrogenase-like enzyme